MRGLILSGGAGTRLRPITHTSAKQLVPIANKPILFYGLEDMARAGIKEIGIVVGDTGDEIRAAVGDGSRFGVKVTFLPQDQPRGLAHAVLIARDFLGEEDFVMYLGDNMLEAGLAGFVDSFVAQRAAPGRPAVAQILLKEVANPSSFGVAEVDAAGEVVRLIEKPAVPPSNLALVGVYLFDRHIHEAVCAIEPSPRGELEITDAIQWLIDQGHPVRHEVLQGWWIDTGKKDPLLECNRLVLDTIVANIAGEMDEHSVVEGRVIIEAGARLVRSRVRGPAVIGANTTLQDSYVGPYSSIAAGCRIVDSEVENSVILEDTAIVGIARLADSLLGRNTEVLRSGQRPAATRLMLGDHSHVDLE